MESLFSLGQPILPTDKHNPAFTLYRTKDEQGLLLIHVYYGLELLEVVPDDHDDPMFRCMIARLRNAGLKLKSLVEVFQLDPKTIRSWSDALKSRDPARMQSMLFGKHAARKLTHAIESFVLKRLPELFAEQRKDFRATLQREIETFFDTRLSTETLRILIADVKRKLDQPITFNDPDPAVAVQEEPVQEDPVEDAPSNVSALQNDAAVEAPDDAPSAAPPTLQNAVVEQPLAPRAQHSSSPLEPSMKGIVSEVSPSPPDSPTPVITGPHACLPDKVTPLF
jgi:hypothetical protein